MNIYEALPETSGGLLTFDIETTGFLNSNPDIHLIVIDDTPYITPEEQAAAIQRLMTFDGFIAGHNVIKFDIPAMQLHFPEFKPKRVFDSLVASRLIYTNLMDQDGRLRGRNPNFPAKLMGKHSLKAWGWRLGEYKGDYGDVENAWDTLTPEMVEYCVQDVAVTQKFIDQLLAKKYSPRAYELEHNFADIIAQQERNGFAFNVTKAGELLGELSIRRAELKAKVGDVFPGWYSDMKKPEYIELHHLGQSVGKFATKSGADTHRKSKGLPPKECEYITGPPKQKHTPFNPGSRDHVSKAFREKYKWEPTEFTNDGKAKIDDDILKDLPFPEAKVLAEYFMVQKRIGMLAEGSNSWLKLVHDGRIYGSVITNGAVTGRCTHSHPNVAQTPSVGAPYGAQCRALFEADPGEVLVGADASGLELRTFAHFLARWDHGQYADLILNGDIHTYNQKAANLPTRDNAKTFIYAMLYGAGDQKIGSIVGRGAKAGKALKKTFMANVPAYANLVQAVKAASKRGYLIGLDGRHLHVRSEHSALNTLLQSAGALVMKRGAVEATQLLAGTPYKFVANVHDEIQVTAPQEHAEFVGQTLVRGMNLAGEYFGIRMPIDGEYKIGKNWAETH